MRPLGLPALEDKIVQKGISRILETIYEADFLDCSYGFRPNRSCHQALNAVDKTIMTRPINHIIEADIKGFFDNVSHEWMMKFLAVRIKDPSFLLLIRRFLKAGYYEADKIVETSQGTPQGGNLSPMLSNIFLHYVLDLWFEKKIKPHVRGQSHLVRYADDYICMVQHTDDAKYIEHALRDLLSSTLSCTRRRPVQLDSANMNENMQPGRNARPTPLPFLVLLIIATRVEKESL
jgi:group II intron reverse transcriptase/maturase